MNRLVSALLIAFASTAGGANPASDNASHAAYDDGWQTGDNGGSGFGAWTLTLSSPTGDRNGHFMGDSTGNGSAPSGGINTSGRSWGLYANQLVGMSGPDIGNAQATRPFTGGELAVGQSLLLRMDNGFLDPWFLGNSAVGFSLNRFSFFFASNGTEYRIGYGDPNDPIGLQGTGIPFTDDGLAISFTRTGADSYTLDVTPNGGSTVSINGVMSQTGGLLDSITLYNRTAGPGADHNAFFNSMSIVPEPSTIALGLLGAATAVLRALRRRVFT